MKTALVIAILTLAATTRIAQAQDVAAGRAGARCPVYFEGANEA